MEKLESYFDLMAITIKHILKVYDSNRWKEKSIRILDNKRNGFRDISDELPLLIDDNCEVISLDTLVINLRLCSDIRDFIKKYSNNALKLIYLLIAMDESFKALHDIEINNVDDYHEVGSLNSKSTIDKTQLLILRQYRPDWENRTQTNLKHSLNHKFLKNFYYIDKGKISCDEVKNYFMKKNILYSQKKKSLNIGISPLLSENIISVSKPFCNEEESEAEDLQYVFNVEPIGSTNEDKIEKKIEIIIDEAEKNMLDILMFPEMLGTEANLKQIQHYLQSSKKEKPEIIVFPSIWKKTEDNKNSNVAVVLDKTGKEIFRQYKRTRYCYIDEDEGKTHGMHIFENINCKNNNIINILNIPEIGRLCILICYDYLDEVNRNEVFDNLIPTLVLTPSFSTGSRQFEIVKELSFQSNCNWVWCNTCTALNIAGRDKETNFELIGIITNLSKNNEVKELHKQFNGIASCQKKKCDLCLYYSEINYKEGI